MRGSRSHPSFTVLRAFAPRVSRIPAVQTRLAFLPGVFVDSRVLNDFRRDGDQEQHPGKGWAFSSVQRPRGPALARLVRSVG